ncbi:MAG: HEPN domain-containing protein [Marinobacterium sp.]|nr:HEPN domain-containing protein [Marinobacterium sp.]
MKKSLDHLPASKQRDIDYILSVIRDEFEQVVGFAQGKKKHYRIQKVILFGSHATGKWVYDPANGYLSDYDILVILNDQATPLLQEPRLWQTIEDRISLYIKPPVTLILHTLHEVNHALSEGQYFFSDIKQQGVVLYELEPKPLANACDLSPAQARALAERHFSHWFDSGNGFMKGVRFYQQEEDLKKAAFMLHQATETYYSCIMLVFTNYKPNTHNLIQLNNLAIGQHPDFAIVFPQQQRIDRSRFQLLKRAYIDARYSEHFEINKEQLEWLIERVEILRGLTERLCEEKIKCPN